MTPFLLPSPDIPGDGAGTGFAEAISTTRADLKRRATFFRDKLSCPAALYLDGAISRFYPGEKPAGGVESNFAGIFAILENRQRLQGRHSPGPDSRAANDKDKGPQTPPISP